MSDSAKANDIVSWVAKNKNTNNNFKERHFLPTLKNGVSMPSKR
jgi:hypothetical protein